MENYWQTLNVTLKPGNKLGGKNGIGTFKWFTVDKKMTR